MDFEKKLELFRDFELSKENLFNGLPEPPLSKKVDSPILITTDNVIKVLKMLKDKKIVKDDVVQWVNVIWFSDWYDYKDEEADCIAGIMNELEELDEIDTDLSPNTIDKYIFALKNNEEL